MLDHSQQILAVTPRVGSITPLPAVIDEADLGRAAARGEMTAKCDRSQTRHASESRALDVTYVEAG